MACAYPSDIDDDDDDTTVTESSSEETNVVESNLELYMEDSNVLPANLSQLDLTKGLDPSPENDATTDKTSRNTNKEYELVRTFSSMVEAQAGIVAVSSCQYVPFLTNPVLELKDWTNAWKWSSLDKDIIHYKADDRDVYCMASGLESKLSKLSCKKYFNIVDERRWSNFDEYKSHIHSINYVEFNRKDWIKSKCSCVWWAKNYCCHHVIGLAVSKKKCEYKDVHMLIPIGISRGRGQPKKTATALTRQEENFKVSEDSASSDNSDDSDPSPVKRKVVVKKTTKKTTPKKITPKKRGRKLIPK